MITAAIPVVVWIVWAIIGFCGGYMTSRLCLHGRRQAIMSVVGMAGGVGGGILFMVLAGQAAAEKTETLSLLCALAGTALFVWLATLALGRTQGDDNGDD